MRLMATKKKSESVVRGAALMKKAIIAAQEKGLIDSPEPVAAGVLKKLRLPNDEKLSPAMKELLAFDSSWLGWAIDDEEPELEPMSLDEFVEQEFGEDQVESFGEAVEMLSEDCLPLGESGETKSFVYVGSPDEKGEYAVITLEQNDGSWVKGFVPFDIWVAQQFGLIEGSADEALCKALADENGDGRVSFKSESRELERDSSDDDEDEDEDSDDEDEDEDEAGDEEKK
jgi:hypothetical protein